MVDNETAVFKIAEDGIMVEMAQTRASVKPIPNSQFALFYSTSDNVKSRFYLFTRTELAAIRDLFTLFLNNEQPKDEPIVVKFLDREVPTGPVAERSSRRGRTVSDKTRANGRVLEAIFEAEESISVHEIAARTGLSEGTVGKAVLYLYRMGRVERECPPRVKGAPYLYWAIRGFGR